MKQERQGEEVESQINNKKFFTINICCLSNGIYTKKKLHCLSEVQV